MALNAHASGVGVLRDRHFDLNPVTAEYERTTLLEGQLTQLCEFNVPGGSEASFETVPLSIYKPALIMATGVSEYAVRIETGDHYNVAMPANWDPNNWSIGAWFVPDFDSTDGQNHYLLWIDGGANNDIVLRTTTGGNLLIRCTVGGVNYDAQLSKTFSAGQAIFIGATKSGASLTLYADTNSDGTMETANNAAAGIFGALTWTAAIGSVLNGSSSFLQGAVSLLIANTSASAAVTDRFASGAGQSISTWLATYGQNVVLHVGGDATTARLATYQGGTDATGESAAQGRYDFVKASSQYIDFGNRTEFDAATMFWALVEVEIDLLDASVRHIVTRWSTAAASDQQWRLGFSTTDKLFAAVSDGVTILQGSSSSVWAAGERRLVLLRVDLTQATDAARLKIDTALYNATTKKYAAWLSDTLVHTGTAPAALVTAAGTPALRLGVSSNGASYLDGKIDLFRWAVGSTLTDAQRDAIIVNEANPALAQHSYNFDGDANDEIGTINGTVTGATQVTDNRHDVGGFGRFTKAGQYYTDGVNDSIAHGSYTPLNGAAKAKFVHIVTPGPVPAGNAILAERGRAGTDGQIRFLRSSTDQLIVYVPTSASDTATWGVWNNFFAEGVPTWYEVEFDGTSGGGNAGRLVVKKSTFDKTTGLWSALASVTATSFGGTIPAALLSPVTNTTLYVARNNSGTTFCQGLHDRFAAHAGSLPASFSPYASGAASYDIWADYNGNANNAGLGGATYNGTVTGAIQWYDGRQPSGWTAPVVTGAAEIDRATGEATKGTWGLRIKNLDGTTSGAIQATTSPTAAIGDLTLIAAQARQTTGTGVLRLLGTAFATITQSFSNGAMALQSFASRATAAGTVLWRIYPQQTVGNQIYLDEVVAIKFAPLTPSTATKGTALPALAGAGNALGVAIATITDPATLGLPDAFDASLSAYGQKVVKLDTGITGTQTRRYRWGGNWGLNGLTAGQYASMSVLVCLASGSAVTPANVKLRCVDSVGNTVGTAMTAKNEWQILRVQRQINAAATYAYFELQIEDGNNFATANDFVAIALPTIVAANVIPSFIVNDAEGTVTMSADNFYWDFTSIPTIAPFTGYLRVIERGTVKTSTARLIHVGSDTQATAPKLEIYESGGFYRLTHDNGVSQVHSTLAAAPALGDLVELRAVVYSDGSVELFQSINNAAETTGSRSAALTLQSAWAAERMYFNSGGSTLPGYTSMLNNHWRQGVVDLATMRSYAGVS